MMRRPLSPSNITNQSRTRPPSPDAYHDIIIEVDGVAFAVNKDSLCARSGQIKKLVKQYGGPGPSKIGLHNLPGGADAFALAVKFCYGIQFEINSSHVAVLRCVAEYLEMTEEYGRNNLVACIELFLEEAVFKSLKECVQVLCSCENILSQAEDVNLVRRCTDAVASIICDFDAKHSNAMQGSKQKQGLIHTDAGVDWWADELLPLPIFFFKQAVQAMKCKGLGAASVAGALMHYAHKALKLSSFKPSEAIFREQQQDGIMIAEHEQRIILETIVNLLPAKRGVVPNAFLFRLLQTGFLLDTTVACQMELEKRIGAQLEQATLEELLVPSYLSHGGDTVFDVDLVRRLVVNFAQEDEISNPSLVLHHSVHEDNNANSSSSQMAFMKVARLLDSYLAEVAADANMKVANFINLMELLPHDARVLDDGLYRAIDIYLKAHPTIADIDKRKICNLMDCQKLSQEACSHAAQNERLPVHVIVQVLYVMQLRGASSNSSAANAKPLHPLYTSQRMGADSARRAASSTENYASLKQETEDLRLEVTRMRTQLNYLEKRRIINASCLIEKTSSVKKMLRSVSRTFSRINPFARSNSKKESLEQQESEVRMLRRQRYSIS